VPTTRVAFFVELSGHLGAAVHAITVSMKPPDYP